MNEKQNTMETKWISTKERLPENTNDILFHDTENNWLLLGYYDISPEQIEKRGLGMCEIIDGTDKFYAVNEDGAFELEEVDYWMPIPDVPVADWYGDCKRYTMSVDPAKEGEDKTSVSLVELDANEIKKICTIYENLNQERKRASILYNSDETFFNHVLAEYKTCKK